MVSVARKSDTTCTFGGPYAAPRSKPSPAGLYFRASLSKGKPHLSFLRSAAAVATGFT